MSAIERLVQDAATLGVTLRSEDAAGLLRLTEELARWNRSYNLTATGDVGIGNPFLGGGGPRGIQLAAKITF